MSRSRSRSRDPSLQPVPSGLSATARGGDGRPSFELSKLEEEGRGGEHNEAAQ